jgi:hypothetical protein
MPDPRRYPHSSPDLHHFCPFALGIALAAAGHSPVADHIAFVGPHSIALVAACSDRRSMAAAGSSAEGKVEPT